MVELRLRHGIVIVAAVLLIGCLSPPDPGESPGNFETIAPPEVNNTSPQDLPDLEKFLGDARELAALGNHAESIHLLAVLTQIAPDSETGVEAGELLSELSSAIRLEPSLEWLGADGSQLVGSTRELQAPNLRPAALVATMREGPARVALHGLTVRFTLVEEGRTIEVTHAQTSEFGTVAAAFGATAGGRAPVNIIAEAVTVTEYGLVELGGESVVFRYLSPGKTLAVMSAILIDNRVESASELGTAAAESLSPLGSITERDGSVIDHFRDGLAGDPVAVSQLGVASDARYICFAVLVTQPAAQVEYQGKLYDIWRADGTVHLVLIDSFDGVTVFSASAEPPSGQGGSDAAAIGDLVVNAAAAIDSLVIANYDRAELAIAGPRE